MKIESHVSRLTSLSLAVFCVVLAAFAITGCSGTDAGSTVITTGNSIAVPVDTSLPGVTSELLAHSYAGYFPTGTEDEKEDAILKFIGEVSTLRNNYVSLPSTNMPRAVGDDTANTVKNGESYSNYKVSDRDIYVQGYYNSVQSQSYRSEDGPEEGDTFESSFENVWATTYDDEGFPVTTGFDPTTGASITTTYSISGKVVRSMTSNQSGTYTVSNSSRRTNTYSQTWNNSNKQAFSIGNGTFSLRYIIEESTSGSDIGENKSKWYDDPPSPYPANWYPEDYEFGANYVAPPDFSEFTLAEIDEYWDDHVDPRYNVKITIYDKSGNQKYEYKSDDATGRRFMLLKARQSGLVLFLNSYLYSYY
jgi:hypothetical protein